MEKTQEKRVQEICNEFKVMSERDDFLYDEFEGSDAEKNEELLKNESRRKELHKELKTFGFKYDEIKSKLISINEKDTMEKSIKAKKERLALGMEG
jgi:hypothetical protein